MKSSNISVYHSQTDNRIERQHSDVEFFETLIEAHKREQQFFYLEQLVSDAESHEIIDHFFQLKEHYLQFLEVMFTAVWLQPQDNIYYQADKERYEQLFCSSVDDTFGDQFLEAFKNSITHWLPMMIQTVWAHVSLTNDNLHQSKQPIHYADRISTASWKFLRFTNTMKEESIQFIGSHELALLKQELNNSPDSINEATVMAETIEKDIQAWYSYLAILWRLMKEKYFILWWQIAPAHTPTIEVRFQWIAFTVAKQSDFNYQSLKVLPPEIKALVDMEIEALNLLKDQTKDTLQKKKLNDAIIKAKKILRKKNNQEKAIVAYQKYCQSKKIRMNNIRWSIWIAWWHFQNETYRAFNKMSRRALLQIKNIGQQIDVLQKSMRETIQYRVTRWRANPTMLRQAQHEITKQTQATNKKILTMQQTALNQMRHLDTKTILREAQKPWFINSFLHFNKHAQNIHWWIQKIATHKKSKYAVWFLLWMWVWTYIHAGWSEVLDNDAMMRTLWNDLWDMIVWFIPIVWWVNDLYIAIVWTDWNKRALTSGARAERVLFGIVGLLPWVWTLIKVSKNSKKALALIKALEWIQKLSPGLYTMSWTYAVWKLWLVGLASTGELASALYTWLWTGLHALFHDKWLDEISIPEPEFVASEWIEFSTISNHVDSFITWFFALSAKYNEFNSINQLIKIFEETLVRPFHDAVVREYPQESQDLISLYRKLFLQSLYYQWFFTSSTASLPKEYDKEYEPYRKELEVLPIRSMRIVLPWWSIIWERESKLYQDYAHASYSMWPLWSIIIAHPPTIPYDGMKLFVYDTSLDFVAKTEYEQRYADHLTEYVAWNYAFWYNIQGTTTHTMQWILFRDVWLVEHNGKQFFSCDIFDAWKVTTCLIPMIHFAWSAQHGEPFILDLSNASTQWYVNHCIAAAFQQ